AIAKGTEYVLISGNSPDNKRSLSQTHAQTLHIMVAIPKYTYGADVWFRPIHRESADSLQRKSIGTAEHLAKAQRTAALSITGAMRTTATDTLNEHANLLPTLIFNVFDHFFFSSSFSFFSS
ncbi:hypothetical protein BDR06DRAFT_899445, partial [Suillus hirtellus]